MTNNDLASDSSITGKSTPAIEGYVQGRAGVTSVMQKELGANTGNTVFMKDIYKEIVSLKISRGTKDPEHSGTVGYLIHGDGALEELGNKTKLSELPWAALRDSAFVIGYLSMQGVTYRVYSGEKLADMFGVSADAEENDKL